MNIEEVKKTYTDVFTLPDDRVLDLIFAVIINMYVKTDPLWLLLVGSPSSGKSEVIQAFYGVPKVYEVSDITENSFLSGANTGGGEASFLTQMGPFGTIAMKDFTSVLAYRAEKRENILAQMRHIYDGHMSKKTGRGNFEWKGKCNLVGGVTEDIYIKEEEGASMGRRTILYQLPAQSRSGMMAAARKSRTDEAIGLKRERIQEAFAEYVVDQVAKLPDGVLPHISDESSRALQLLADFSTIARTPVTRDRYSRDITFIHSPEMPVRVSEQFHTFAETLQFMYGGTLPRAMEEPLWKIAFDSIPKIRHNLLLLMAEYEKITTKGAAIRLSFSTITARRALEDLNAVKIIDRVPGEGNKDYWRIKPEYRDLFETYANITPRDEILEVPDGEEDQDEGQAAEHESRATDDFERF